MIDDKADLDNVPNSILHPIIHFSFSLFRDISSECVLSSKVRRGG